MNASFQSRTPPVFACILVGVLSAASFAQNAPAPPTPDQCWVRFLSHMRDCCANFQDDSSARATCFQGAQDGLDHCLDGASWNERDNADDPADYCWDEFVADVQECQSDLNLSCGNDQDAVDACEDGALLAYNACIAGVVPAGATLSKLRWWWGEHEEASPVAMGEPYSLSVSVREPRVTGVTFFLLHHDASGETVVIKVGEAALTAHNFWGSVYYFWDAVADTSEWPVGTDGRTHLIARTEFAHGHGPALQVVIDVIEGGDFNHDGQVNVLDTVAYLHAWQERYPRADVNDDGSIDTRDIIAFRALVAGG